MLPVSLGIAVCPHETLSIRSSLSNAVPWLLTSRTISQSKLSPYWGGTPNATNARQALPHWATPPVCTALLTSENHLGPLHTVCLPTVESNSWTFWKRLQSDNTRKSLVARVGGRQGWQSGDSTVSLLCYIAQGPKMCTLRVSLSIHYGLSGCWLCMDIGNKCAVLVEGVAMRRLWEEEQVI